MCCVDAMVLACVPGCGCVRGAVWMPWCWRVCRAAGVCGVLCGCHGVGVCAGLRVCAGCCVDAMVLVCVVGGWCVRDGVWTQLCACR